MPLIAHYPLQEDSGSTAYDVAGNNNGTINGATVGANGILGGSAYDFNSSNGDNVDCGDNFIDGYSRLTVSAWIYPDSWNGQNYVLSKIDSGNPDNFRLRHDSGNFYFYLDEGGNSTLSTSEIPSTGTWSLVTGVYDGSKRKLFYNGKQIASDSLSGSLIDTPGPFGIGAGLGKSTGYFDGRIADVRIYDHALTASEVQYLYSVSQRGSYVSGRQTL